MGCSLGVHPTGICENSYGKCLRGVFGVYTPNVYIWGVNGVHCSLRVFLGV